MIGSSGRMFALVTTAPTRRGRSTHEHASRVIAAQFVHAPLLNVLAWNAGCMRLAYASSSSRSDAGSRRARHWCRRDGAPFTPKYQGVRTMHCGTSGLISLACSSNKGVSRSLDPLAGLSDVGSFGTTRSILIGHDGFILHVQNIAARSFSILCLCRSGPAGGGWLSARHTDRFDDR